MTALNQAFIRAYTRGTTVAPTAAPPPREAPSDSSTQVIQQPTLSPSEQPTAQVTPHTSHAVEPQMTAPPAPHFEPAPSALATELVETAEPARVTLPQIDFRPAWEVDAFEWPRPCDDLLTSAGDAMATTIERLRAVEPQHRDVLVVTSLMRHEGRSTVAICLARAAAAAGLRVALVDADFEQAQLGELLGFATEAGWLAVLRQRQRLTEAAVASVADRLTLFPLSLACLRTSDSSTTDLLRQALRELAASFDLVVVDAAPFQTSRIWDLEAADVAQDALAVVVRDVRITSHKQAADAARQLRQFGYRASGIIENFASVKEE